MGNNIRPFDDGSFKRLRLRYNGLEKQKFEAEHPRNSLVDSSVTYLDQKALECTGLEKLERF